MSVRTRGSVLVDTSVFGAGLTPRSIPLAQPYDRLVVGRRRFISFQTVMELTFGANVAGWGNARRLQLNSLIAGAEVVWAGASLARTCGALRTRCWQAGHALAQAAHNADLWIAATAIHLDLPLVAEDGIFDGAPGLRREEP